MMEMRMTIWLAGNIYADHMLLMIRNNARKLSNLQINCQFLIMLMNDHRCAQEHYNVHDIGDDDDGDDDDGDDGDVGDQDE